MADRVLTLRELNRATLARQMLLERADIPVPTAVERLVGLQAQDSAAPYIGLWTRLKDFQRDDLATLISERQIVKATLMRGTLHLVTGTDYLLLRATLQSALSNGFEAIAKRRNGLNLDRDNLIAVARQYVEEQPRTFAELSDWLSERMPDYDVGLLRYYVRTHLPMVQVPVEARWSYPGNPQFAVADSWLGQAIQTEEKFRELFFRYLAAFGPATVNDFQTWSGFGKMKDAIQAMKGDLQVYRDEKKRELFDLPDVPLPDVETPAPVRFLPEYDNLLLSHEKRTRVIADEHRSKVYLPGLRVAATILVDGFVAGVWKVEKKKGTATLQIEPFQALPEADQRALTNEAERLVSFIEPDAKAFEVRFAD